MMLRLCPVLLLVFLLSCQNTKHEQIDRETVEISGVVHSDEVNEVHFSYGPIPMVADWIAVKEPNAETVQLDQGGNFLISTSQTNGPFYRLYKNWNKVEFFAQENDRIKLDWNADVVFSGDNASLNNYLLNLKQKLKESEDQLIAEVSETYKLGPDLFEQRIASFEKDAVEHLDSFLLTQKKVPSEFEARCRTNISAHFKYFRLLYPRIYKEFVGQWPIDPSIYYADVVLGAFENPQNLSSAEFVRMLERFIYVKLKQKASWEKLFTHYNTIHEANLKPEITDYLMKQLLLGFVDNYGVKDWGKVFDQYKKDYTNNKITEEIQVIYDKEMSKRDKPDEILIFRSIDNVDLEAHVFYPENHDKNDKRSVYVFFHGGGWSLGTPEWGYKDAVEMSERGMVVISFEYRLIDVHGTDLTMGAEDTRHAIAWVRDNAELLGVNPEKIVAAGFSAGGHLAALTAMITDDKLKSSSQPNALIVHSASYNLTKNPWFEEVTYGKPKSVSPFHQAKPNMIPTILFHGDQDHLAPIAEFNEFVSRLKELENDFEYHIFENVGHFFRNDQARKDVDRLTLKFLEKHGF